jgi:hypothetical protein
MPAGTNSLKIVQKYHPNVKRVVDAKRPINVTVTADDCKNAKKGAPSECAMARAFSKNFDGAIISKSVSYLVRGTKAFRYRTPESVTREIVSFDRNNDFAPGDYGLNAPTKCEKLAWKSEHQKKVYALRVPGKSHRLGDGRKDAPSGKVSKKPKRKYHHTAGVRSL